MLAPVREWLGSDRLDDQIAGSAGVLDQLVDIGEARIVAGLRNAEMRERIADQAGRAAHAQVDGSAVRSEEHTSELQSLMRSSYAVFCLKKNTNTSNRRNTRRQN